MGRTLIALCQHTPGVKLGAAIEAPGSAMIGKDAGELAGIGKLGVSVSDTLDAVTEGFTVLISFTLADALPSVLSQCQQQSRPIVIGTTGLDDAQKQRIQQTARDIPIVFAPNMSIGVNLCLEILRVISRVIGTDADIEIIEAHHRGKKDAPSGTALHMGEVIATTLGRELRQCAVYGRHSSNDTQRQRESIAFSSIRAGDIIGEHTAMFACAGERIELSHRATSRDAFASGALRAALWLSTQPPGLYDMRDVLGLNPG